MLRAKGRLWKVQVPFLIHSFIEYLPSARSMLGAVVANYRVNKSKSQLSGSLQSPGGCAGRKQTNKWTKEFWVVLSVMKKIKPGHVIDSD